MRRGFRRVIGGTIGAAVAASAMLAGAAGFECGPTFKMSTGQRFIGVARGGLEWRDDLFGSISFTGSGPEGFEVLRLSPRPRWWFAKLDGLLVEGVFAPLWPLGLAGVAVAAWGWVASRPRPGVCVRCGYDLRGISGAACPECGTLHAACASSTSQPG